MTIKNLIIAALAVALCAPAGALAANGGLNDARAGTAQYHRLAAAQADGYGLLVDKNGIACIAQPGEGTMGIHYVNGTLVGDAEAVAETPEALVYEPEPNGGRMRLVAAEYVVFEAAWDPNGTHRPPPRLFGQDFELVPEGNRYGLPAFYELHAWVWKHNPSGMFADWNPRVSC